MRARRGSIASEVLVGLPDDLNDGLRHAAERDGVPLVEWIREAVRQRLDRETATTLAQARRMAQRAAAVINAAARLGLVTSRKG